MPRGRRAILNRRSQCVCAVLLITGGLRGPDPNQRHQALFSLVALSFEGVLTRPPSADLSPRPCCQRCLSIALGILPAPTSFSCCIYAPIVHRPAATDRRRNVNVGAGFRRLGTQPPADAVPSLASALVKCRNG